MDCLPRRSVITRRCPQIRFAERLASNRIIIRAFWPGLRARVLVRERSNHAPHADLNEAQARGMPFSMLTLPGCGVKHSERVVAGCRDPRSFMHGVELQMRRAS